MTKKENLLQAMIPVAIGSGALLLIPFIMMFFVDGMVWTLGDFVVAGVLFFVTGLAYKLITRSAANVIHRIAAGSAIFFSLFFVWSNLAVGLIGAGPNPGNLMYIGVLVVGIAASVHMRFRAAGMAKAMLAMVTALIIHTVIALLTGMQNYPGSSILEIIGVNGFFAGLFLISGFLFWLAAKQPKSPGKENV